MSDYLPEGLVIEILLYLPPTTLGKFISVCKAWNKIIKSHTFISSHLQRSLSKPTPPRLLIRQFKIYDSDDGRKVFDERYDIYSNAHKIRTLRSPFPLPINNQIYYVGSLHGIVCFIHKHCARFNPIILWNPLIDKYVRIQNPNDLYHTLGFGFDSNKNDFKVIHIDRSHQVELYSLNEDTWRVIDVSYPNFGRFKWFSERQCFLNGNVHWIAGYVTNDNTSVVSLLMLNLEEEKFKTMELPPELVNLYYYFGMKVTVIEGCLSVINHSYYDDRFDIWVMREYGMAESWTKMCIHIQGGIRDVFGVCTSAKVIVVPDNQEKVSLQSFDINSQEMTDLHIQNQYFWAFDYTASLILLDKRRDSISNTFTVSVKVLKRHLMSHQSHSQLQEKNQTKYENLKIVVGGGVGNGNGSMVLDADDTDATTFEEGHGVFGMEGFSYDHNNDAFVEPNHYEPPYHPPSPRQYSPSSHFPLNSEVSAEKSRRHKQGRFEFEGSSSSIGTNIQANVLEKLSIAIGTIAVNFENISNLMEKRERDRELNEIEKRERESKINIWDAIKEIPNLDDKTRYMAAELLDTKAKYDFFLNMSQEECSSWINFKLGY